MSGNILFYIFEIKTILTGGFERSFNNIRSEITIGRYSNNFFESDPFPKILLEIMTKSEAVLIMST